MVDKVGSLNDAVKLAAEAAGIEDYSLSNYPTQKGAFEQVMESFGGVKAYAMKQFIGLDEYSSKILMKNLKNHDVRQAIMLD